MKKKAENSAVALASLIDSTGLKGRVLLEAALPTRSREVRNFLPARTTAGCGRSL